MSDAPTDAASAPTAGARAPTAAASWGRAAAWLAKQVELGLADVELTLPQYRVLGVLAEGATIPSALADRLTVRRPTVTAVVDGLETRRLVQCGTDQDRRRVTHTLTARGRKVLAQADAAVDARLAAIADALEDPALARRALDDLDLWRRAIRAHRRRVMQS